MIKVIFFDMFNVVFSGDFRKAIDKYEEEFKIKKGYLYEVIHNFQGWKDFSLGRINQEEFFKLCTHRAKNFVFDGNHFLKLFRENIYLNQSVVDLIKYYSKNYIIGVISNAPREWYDVIIEDFDLGDIFKIEAVSGYLHLRKPDQEIFQKALKLAGVNGDQSIYIDDRGDRVGGAMNLGMKVVIFDGDTKKLKNKIDILLDS